ncbi:T9SS type A sorting domain-containing protein [uncultured Aquimarina sp.]|uniref:T9SS type A sorting domain-containing protein n=1 Tax=uncultured Aquimarina sp. TaxID=575652 RepID=UPI00260D5840|nr:T9SS type A sorting domain-containing protein [uncultured Aquimarina sp.]
MKNNLDMNTQSILQNNLEKALDSTFSIYLNQLLNTIYIDLDKEDANVSYSIYDKKGKIIKTKCNLSRRNTLSLTSFPSGVYTVEVSDNIHKITKQILKF